MCVNWNIVRNMVIMKGGEFGKRCEGWKQCCGLESLHFILRNKNKPTYMEIKDRNFI